MNLVWNPCIAEPIIRFPIIVLRSFRVQAFAGGALVSVSIVSSSVVRMTFRQLGHSALAFVGWQILRFLNKNSHNSVKISTISGGFLYFTIDFFSVC